MMHLTLVNDTKSIFRDIYPDLNINQVIGLSINLCAENVKIN